jgi:hypothetical protein
LGRLILLLLEEGPLLIEAFVAVDGSMQWAFFISRPLYHHRDVAGVPDAIWPGCVRYIVLRLMVVPVEL